MEKEIKKLGDLASYNVTANVMQSITADAADMFKRQLQERLPGARITVDPNGIELLANAPPRYKVVKAFRFWLLRRRTRRIVEDAFSR